MRARVKPTSWETIEEESKDFFLQIWNKNREGPHQKYRKITPYSWNNFLFAITSHDDEKCMCRYC